VTAPAPPPFDAVVLRGPGMVVVRLAGELDCASAPHLAAAIEEALQYRPAALTVEMKDVTFLDPAGARPLRALSRQGDPALRLRLRGATGTVRRVLELLGLAGLLQA